jgi:hypothetical protein
MDIWYVHNASFGLDLVVIANTVRTVLLGERTNRAAVDQARTALAARGGAFADFRGAQDSGPGGGPLITGARPRRVA